MNVRAVLAGVCLVAAVGTVILFLRDKQDPLSRSPTESNNTVGQDNSGRPVLYWYDPMMPQQRFEKPGKSPFMDMQLVPKYANESNVSGVQVAPAVQQNLGMRLARAERSSFGSRITAVARLEANERALHAVPSRVAGYVERLQVRAVGDPVKQGQLLAQIYSPELVSAQNEYLALRRAQNLADASDLTMAAQQRLRLLGMAASEVEALERSGEASARFGVYSPISGFVTELATREGGPIEGGATLVSIADLSTLWLIAEVPEREATAIRPGDEVRATLSSGSQDPITGKIDSVYPTLNTQSRTARVRVVVPNSGGTLRPGMLANVAILAAQRQSLSVPSEAVIFTGTRSIVIAKEGDTFRPAEVRVGGEFGDQTEILAGLEDGEQVVASGQFLIDSEASLNGVLARLAHTEGAAVSTTPTTSDDVPAVITSRGDVVSVDVENGRVTLAHEPISQLQWPAMTMPFRLADSHAAHTLAAGDHVRFTLRPKPENGEYVIESITKERAR